MPVYRALTLPLKRLEFSYFGLVWRDVSGVIQIAFFSLSFCFINTKAHCLGLFYRKSALFNLTCLNKSDVGTYIFRRGSYMEALADSEVNYE